MSDDSGPNLGVRGAAALLIAAGLFLIYTGNRVRKGASRLRFTEATAIYGFGAFTLVGAAAIAFGAFLLGASA